MNRNRFIHLKKVIYGISTFKGRESHEAFPIRDKILKKLIMSFKLNYQGILKKTMLAFAKSFALRIGEYTSSHGYPSARTLKWSDLKILNENKSFIYN